MVEENNGSVENPHIGFNCLDWLETVIDESNPVVRYAGREDYLALWLSDALRNIRESSQMTEADINHKLKQLGCGNYVLSNRVETTKCINVSLRTLLLWVHALDAELLIAIKVNGNVYQITDPEGGMLTDMSEEIIRIVSLYCKSVNHPNSSGAEHLEMLHVRDKIESCRNSLSFGLLRRLEKADKTLLENALVIHEAIAKFINFSEERLREPKPPSHWWWYLDVLIHAGVSK